MGKRVMEGGTALWVRARVTTRLTWRWLLLSSAIALAAISCALAYVEARGVLPSVPWLLSLPLAILAFEDARESDWTRRDQFTMVGLLVAGLLSRVLFVERWPSFINPDEPIFGVLTVDLLAGKSSVFVRGWLGEPYTSLVPFAVGIKLFGQDISALRIPDGIIGAVAVPALYVLGKRAFGRTAGLFAALFLLANVAAFHLSRTGLSNVQAMTLMVIGAAALLTALADPSRNRQWAIVGLSIGLTFCIFSSALAWDVVAMVTIIPFVPRLVSSQELFNRVAIAVVVPALIAAAPILTFLSRHPHELAGHALSIAVWNKEALDHEIYSYHLRDGDLTSLWRIQVERSLGGLITIGDTQTDYASERGLLDPVAAVALILGLVVLVRQLRTHRALMLLTWLIATLVLGSIIIEDPPQATKLLVLIPAACLVSGLGLAALLSGMMPKRHKVAALLGVGCIAVGAAIGFSYYFGRYQLVPSQRTTVLSRYVRSVAPAREVCLVDLDVPPKNEALRFLAPSARVVAWDTKKVPPTFDPGSSLAFVAAYSGGDAARSWNVVTARYPSGNQQVLFDSNGQPILRVWEVLARPTT